VSKIVLPDKVSNIPGLAIVCRCSKQVPPSEYKDGLCWSCWVTEKCAGYRAEIVRLYKKKVRYDKRGAPTAGSDEIAGRVRARIVRVVLQLTNNQKKIEELVNEQGRLAREAASSSRIMLPGSR
jgi:hypothetical protein